MMETVQAYIKTINARKHVLLLIENIDLTIKLTAKEQSVFLCLKNGKVYLATESDPKTWQCEIMGEYKTVIDMILGKEKLRTLINKGDLRVTASFRTLLLLESLFYLAKTAE